MPEFLVAIAEGSRTIAGELPIETRIALADVGFREAAQVEYSEAVWAAEQGEPDASIFRRIVYRYDAVDEASAASDALALVGAGFDVRTTELDQ